MGQALPNKGHPGPVTCESENVLHPIGSSNKMRRELKQCMWSTTISVAVSSVAVSSTSTTWMVVEKPSVTIQILRYKFLDGHQRFSSPSTSSTSSGWWLKSFRHHPNPETDTETDADYKRLWINGMSAHLTYLKVRHCFPEGWWLDTGGLISLACMPPNKSEPLATMQTFRGSNRFKQKMKWFHITHIVPERISRSNE